MFPSERAEGGHIVTIQREFARARAVLGIDEGVVPYLARHTFGTDVLEATGNLAVVMRVMGHADTRTAMRYQHPSTLEPVRQVIAARNAARLTAQNTSQ